MKKKKILIISIIVIILVILCVLGIFLYHKHQMKQNEKEYENTAKKYERLINIAEKLNTMIDEKVKSTQEFLATNPDVRTR